MLVVNNLIQYTLNRNAFRSTTTSHKYNRLLWVFIMFNTTFNLLYVADFIVSSVTCSRTSFFFSSSIHIRFVFECFLVNIIKISRICTNKANHLRIPNLDMEEKPGKWQWRMYEGTTEYKHLKRTLEFDCGVT